MFTIVATTARAVAPHVGQALIHGGKVVVAAGIAAKASQQLNQNATQMCENLSLAMQDGRTANEINVPNTIGFQADNSAA